MKNKTIYLFSFCLLLQGCAIGIGMDYKRKQKIYSTGVMDWKDEIRVILGNIEIKDCKKVAKSIEFKRSKFNSSSESYLEFLIFVRNHNANVAIIEKMNKESFFNKLTLSANLYNCDDNRLRNYTIEYIDDFKDLKCNFIKKLTGRYNLPLFGVKKRAYEKFSVNETWARLNLEQQALKVGVSTLQIESIKESFWSGDITIKASAFRCRAR